MKKQLSILPRHWISLALLLATLFFVPVGRGLAQGTTVVVDPPSREVLVGNTTTVDIRVESVANLSGAEVHLKFDPATLVEVVDADPGMAGVQIEHGPLLTPFFTAQNVVDETAGEIHYAIAQGPTDSPVSGSGVLATITFRGVGEGVSALNFTKVILAASGGAEIASGSQGGSISVVTETATPTATSTPSATPTVTMTPTSGPSPTPTLTPTTGPSPTPTVTPYPTPILGYHTVKAGETLFCIGRAYRVDPYAIARQNGILNPNIIRAGQRLAIPNVPRSLPAGKVCPRQFDGTPTPPTCRWNHTVAWGENLYRISLRYGVSMWTIAEVNHITNLNFILAGRVLCIP